MGTGQLYVRWVDVDEMTRLLCVSNRSIPTAWSSLRSAVEVHNGRTCVRRRLKSGGRFELIAGADLASPETQQKVFGYLGVAKPLIPMERWHRRHLRTETPHKLSLHSVVR